VFSICSKDPEQGLNLVFIILFVESLAFVLVFVKLARPCAPAELAAAGFSSPVLALAVEVRYHVRLPRSLTIVQPLLPLFRGSFTGDSSGRSSSMAVVRMLRV
jgi:hypothetical protein